MRWSAHVAAFALLPAMVLSSAACSIDISAHDTRYVDTVEKQFTLTGAPQVHLETFDGSVEVDTWDRNEVRVTIERHASDKAAAERLSIATNQDGDRVSVVVKDQPGDGRPHVYFGSASARLIVTVPVRATMEVATGEGRVTVRDVVGAIDVKTGDGSVVLSGVNGEVNVSSGDGSLELDGIMPRLAARSGDGRVRVRTSSTAAIGEWKVSTGDGSVVVEVPEGFGAELAASTGDGRVAVHDLPFAGASDRHERGSASGRLGNGGGQLSIRTGDGSITVRKASGSSSSPDAH